MKNPKKFCNSDKITTFALLISDTVAGKVLINRNLEII